MSFKVKVNPTFVGETKIHVPGEGPKPLKLVFKHKRSEAAAEFYQRAAELSLDVARPISEQYASHLLEIVEGWCDVDMEFSAEAFAELLANYAFAAQAIQEAYFEELAGARRGN